MRAGGQAGMRRGGSLDWIALLDLAVAPLHLCAAATRRLRLLNWRQGVRVALLRGGLERPAVVALSDAISPANPNEPTQAHLALTGKDG